MQRLSVLIFSRNDVDKALDLIQDLYKIASEIILMDSSNKEGKERLLKRKEKLELGKVRIFNVVALGYPDPLRMYALAKCKNEWVLLIDTDELYMRYDRLLEPLYYMITELRLYYTRDLSFF